MEMDAAIKESRLAVRDRESALAVARPKSKSFNEMKAFAEKFVF